ncbi:hypothetical protein BT96DRAFT_1020185 [Gymnopus androsaceus JB14]|uniref:Uncharacterized protein n=1 Tax=Gymnopus androsaceus JB14 TaxID=1447944 RepID=A0A6A4HL77_9AGAR|nr:hypothetical protein BT96DRAFT_1020185 [Gymnopus androsaceus JB14]
MSVSVRIMSCAHGSIPYYIEIIPETFVYGVYSCLIPFFMFVMLKKGLRTKVRKSLFFMSLFMYTISTVHWTSVDVSLYVTLFSAILLVNYFLTDGVVVWRGFAIFLGNSNPLPSYCHYNNRVQNTTHSVARQPGAQCSHAINASQIANLVISLLTNISATTIISIKAWKFRRDITRGFDKQTNGSRIMALIVESGILYCISALTVLLASLINPEHGTLDIYSPVSFQLAGIYPVVVILLVNQGNSMDKTVFMSTIPTIQVRTHLQRREPS